jgi:uncharacterized protein YigE (DUF2233 family)
LTLARWPNEGFAKIADVTEEQPFASHGIKGSKVGKFTYEGDRPSRRTIVGQDRAGRIILITTNSLIGMRLADLGAYLASTDLDLLNALNLDGGGSTMMVIKTGAPQLVPSFDPVPAVLAVYPRG